MACLSDRVGQVEIAHYDMRSSDRIIDHLNPGKLSVVGQKPVRYSSATTTTLTTVLEASPFRLEEVQYLNVDCEGADLTVLRGLDFDRCRPRILSVEAFTEKERAAIIQFLSLYGYRSQILIPPTMIFVKL